MKSEVARLGISLSYYFDDLMSCVIVAGCEGREDGVNASLGGGGGFRGNRENNSSSFQMLPKPSCLIKILA